MAAGCPEKIDVAFLKWVWRYPDEQRPGIQARLAQVEATKTIIVLKSRKEVRRFIENIA
jgi:hypothetical protein